MKPLERWANCVRSLLDEIEQTQFANIRAAGELVAQSLLDGHTWWLYGTGHHSKELTQEAFFRAGGLALAHLLYDPWGTLPRRGTKGSPTENLEGYGTAMLDNSVVEAGDVLTVISNSGRTVLPVEMAIEARRRGLKVIGLLSVRYATSVEPRHPSGKRLHEVVDVVLDNCGVLGDTILEIEGLPVKVAPTSTIAGATIINAVTICAIERMIEEGVTPPVYRSGHMPGAEQWNRDLLEKWSDRIKYM